MLEITPKKIEQMIYVIRGQKVMLDSDLAELYEVETKMLKRSVRRNIGGTNLAPPIKKLWV